MTVEGSRGVATVVDLSLTRSLWLRAKGTPRRLSYNMSLFVQSLEYFFVT